MARRSTTPSRGRQGTPSSAGGRLRRWPARPGRRQQLHGRLDQQHAQGRRSAPRGSAGRQRAGSVTPGRWTINRKHVEPGAEQCYHAVKRGGFECINDCIQQPGKDCITIYKNRFCAVTQNAQKRPGRFVESRIKSAQNNSFVHSLAKTAP